MNYYNSVISEATDKKRKRNKSPSEATSAHRSPPPNGPAQTRLSTTGSQLGPRTPWMPPILYGVKHYNHPKPEQLRDSEVVLEVDPGQRERIVPIEKLPTRIENFLPPAYAHYDQYSDRLVRGGVGHGDTKKCWSCFSDAHNIRSKQCTRRCQICTTKDHIGGECPMVFATFKWWQRLGHNPQTSITRRPDASELSYLVVAGVIIYKPGMSLQAQIVPNSQHPVVRKFYKLASPEVEAASPPKAIAASPRKIIYTSPSLVLPTERQLVPQSELDEMFAKDTEEMHQMMEEEEAWKRGRAARKAESDEIRKHRRVKRVARADTALAEAEAGVTRAEAGMARAEEAILEAEKALKAARDARDKNRKEAAEARI